MPLSGGSPPRTVRPRPSLQHSGALAVHRMASDLGMRAERATGGWHVTAPKAWITNDAEDEIFVVVATPNSPSRAAGAPATPGGAPRS